MENGIADRFWAKVQRGGADDCWRWAAATDRHGYGVFWARGRLVQATHIALELAGLSRPGALGALHACDTPACVNPKHLRWGSQRENVADMKERGRENKPGAIGERNTKAKLTVADVLAIRASEAPSGTVAAEHGVSRNQVRLIRARRLWRHV